MHFILQLTLIISFLTNFGSTPAGPGNFRFLFVDIIACALFVQREDAADRDLTGNGRLLLQDVVQTTALKLLLATTEQSAATLVTHGSAHQRQHQSQYNTVTTMDASTQNCKWVNSSYQN